MITIKNRDFNALDGNLEPSRKIEKTRDCEVKVCDRSPDRNLHLFDCKTGEYLGPASQQMFNMEFKEGDIVRVSISLVSRIHQVKVEY